MEHGRIAQRGQLPWHVGVTVRRNRGPAFTALEGHRGGGTIVGRRWVATAAHCLAPVSDVLTPGGLLVPDTGVRLSVISGIDLEAPEREVDVTLALVHPQFNPRSLEFDLALLHLSEDLEGGVELGAEDLAVGECGIVAGWGKTHDVPRTSPHLAWARMHVCATLVSAPPKWSSSAPDPRIVCCVGGEEGACPDFPRAAVRKGDSGSGFVVDRAGTPYLCGIVSWSARAAGGDDGPQVLTRTFPLVDWITRETSRRAPCASRP